MARDPSWGCTAVLKVKEHQVDVICCSDIPYSVHMYM